MQSDGARPSRGYRTPGRSERVRAYFTFLLAISALVLMAPNAAAQSGPANCAPLTGAARTASLGEHLYGGSPSGAEPMVRRAYVTEYNTRYRVPRWTAWRVVPSYRYTPTRKGIWATFRRDAEVSDPVVTSNYTSMRMPAGPLHRGHIAPYFIAGGDRNDNGRLAARPNDGLTLDDQEDACTVFEINLMTNIAPQLKSFNGSAGLWYELESSIRDLVDAGHEIHVIAGTVFTSRPLLRGRPDATIGVPDMFYQIVITDAGVVPFLFLHNRRPSGAPGCARNAVLESCIVTVRAIERITSLNFFTELGEAAEGRLEDQVGRTVWESLWVEDE